MLLFQEQGFDIEWHHDDDDDDDDDGDDMKRL